MRYRQLGRTGVRVSEIGFGCGPTARLMVAGDAEERRRAVAHALDLGITYFDTAPAYGDTLSESHLGQALRELGARPVVATKISLGLADLDDVYAAVSRSIEGSLARLGVDVLDVVHVHNRVASTRASKAELGSGAQLSVGDVLGTAGVAEALVRLREEGRVRFLGCSAYGGDMQCIKMLIDSGAFGSVIVNYSMLNTSAFAQSSIGNEDRDYQGVGSFAADRRLGVVALRVLEGGTLAGSAAEPKLAQRAIRFVLSNAGVSTAVIGFSDLAQIDEAISAAQLGPLPDDERAYHAAAM